MQNLEALLDQAIDASDQGDKELAIRIYDEILAYREDWDTVHYNLGLIYKYRLEWNKSYYHNQRAVDLDAENMAAKWNLGIAATMLADWKLARQCWNTFGMNYELIDEDTAANIGETCVRIGGAETVWAIRICPARAMIKNIPFPESEHRFKDVVLNDGAPNGYRMSNGKEYPVLDEIQHLSCSDYQTYRIRCQEISDTQYKDLQQRCWAVDIAIENWSTEIRFLCKQCSEGKPHEVHDHELKNPVADNKIAFATTSQHSLIAVLEAWCEATGADYDECYYF
jgi:hypothetical protein